MRKAKTVYHPRTIPHVILRRKTFFAELEIPAALRIYFGKVRFRATLETSDPKIAERRAPALVAKWRREIAAARGDTDDGAFFARALAKATKAAKPTPDMPQGEPQPSQPFPFKPSLDDEGKLLRGTVAEVHNMMEDAAQREYIDGPGLTRQISEWISAKRTEGTTEKTLGMLEMDVRRFAKAFRRIDNVTEQGVQRWAIGLMEGRDPIAAKTVRRILSALRGYWKFMRAPGKPFDTLELPKANGGRSKKSDQRQPFTPDDVLKLMAAASAKGDAELVDVIDMARWTGARIEELCSLRIENVKLGAKVPYFTVTEAKTGAGLRDIPIHKELLPTLRRLIDNRPEGHVLAKLTENKYGDRSNAVGKRFGYLKKAQNFGEQFVFHSLRKTVASMLKDASVPEATAADILGHEIATMSYGLYAGSVSLETKAEALAKLRYPTS